jgi:hypothetical protein
MLVVQFSRHGVRVYSNALPHPMAEVRSSYSRLYRDPVVNL